MALLDQYEALEPIDGSFLYPNAIESTADEAVGKMELIEFSDTNRLCMSISESANYLSQTKLHPRLIGVEKQNLNSQLQELASEIKNAPITELTFPKRMARNTNAYKDLLAVFGHSWDDEIYTVIMPSNNIKSITTLAGQQSESSYSPRIIFRVLTGLEQPISVIKDGEIADESAPARWFDFTISQCTIRTFGLNIK